MELSKNFFKKLEKLSLVEEATEESKVDDGQQNPRGQHLQRDSSFISQTTQRSNFPRLMPQLSMIRSDPETDYLNKAFRLKPFF